jgi:hypothetical protein
MTFQKMEVNFKNILIALREKWVQKDQQRSNQRINMESKRVHTIEGKEWVGMCLILWVHWPWSNGRRIAARTEKFHRQTKIHLSLSARDRTHDYQKSSSGQRLARFILSIFVSKLAATNWHSRQMSTRWVSQIFPRCHRGHIM